MPEFSAVCAAIHAEFAERNAAREAAIARSRALIRLCSEAIRAVHRREWAAADSALDTIAREAGALFRTVAPYPDLRTGGYTADAFKEVVEAFCTAAWVRGRETPAPEQFTVEGTPYITGAIFLNGAAEAATELRRFILDGLRTATGEADAAEAERLLAIMDGVYEQLVTFDYPDAITGDLRRRTDTVRGVLEKTRGDLTATLTQARVTAALERALTALARHTPPAPEV
jgi:translin